MWQGVTVCCQLRDHSSYSTVHATTESGKPSAQTSSGPPRPIYTLLNQTCQFHSAPPALLWHTDTARSFYSHQSVSLSKAELVVPCTWFWYLLNLSPPRLDTELSCSKCLHIYVLNSTVHIFCVTGCYSHIVCRGHLYFSSTLLAEVKACCPPFRWKSVVIVDVRQNKLKGDHFHYLCLYV